MLGRWLFENSNNRLADWALCRSLPQSQYLTLSASTRPPFVSHWIMMTYRYADKVSKWGSESAAASGLSRYSKINRQFRGFTAFAL